MGRITLFLLHVILLQQLENELWSVIAAGTIKGGLCRSSICHCDSQGDLTCNCGSQSDELILTSEEESRLSSFTSRIIIQDCQSLVIMNSSFIHLHGLRLIKFERIKNIELFSESFKVSSRAMRINVNIKWSNIKILPSYAFSGGIEVINFKMVTIDMINSFAFSNLAGIDMLRFEDCHLRNIETQAFKKFNANYFYIIRGTIDLPLPSRTINDIRVFTEFCLDSIRISMIKSSAIIVKESTIVLIQNCVIENLEAEAFDISTRGSVTIKNNTFGSIAVGSFMGIKRQFDDDQYDTLPHYRINFINNTLNYLEEGSLMFNRDSFQLLIANVLINDTCRCDHLRTWKNHILNGNTKFHTSLSSQQLKNKSTDFIEQGTYLCLDESLQVLNFDEFELRMCTIENPLMFVVLGTVLLIILLIIGMSIATWYYKKSRVKHRKWISIPTSTSTDPDSRRNRVTEENTNNNVTMILPDGRVYRETEFHIIVEKTEPLTTEL